MDEKQINDLALELEGEQGDDKGEKDKKTAKKKAQIEHRLAAEKKKEAKKKGKVDDDEDDDAALEMFVKGSRTKKA
jgi:hypothetical protein